MRTDPIKAPGPVDVDSDRPGGSRPLEWDIGNGVILRKAREYVLPAPISEVLVPLLAAAGDGPGNRSSRR